MATSLRRWLQRRRWLTFGGYKVQGDLYFEFSLCGWWGEAMLTVCFDDDGANSNARAGQKTRTHTRGIRADQGCPGPGTEFHGVGDFFGDVERALLLQKYAPAPQGFSHEVASHSRWSGGGERGHHRHR